MSYDAGRPYRAAGPAHLQRPGDRELPALQPSGIYNSQPVPMDPEYSNLFPQYHGQNVGPSPSQYSILPHQARHTHTCSADSPYAHPDEDWRNEPDLGRRRRVQNRVAQRKYRACKKEKERMGKVEKPSHGSNSASIHDRNQAVNAKASRFNNRPKIRFRDVAPSMDHTASSLSPRAPSNPVTDFPRTIAQPAAANYQVHYTTAPYQVNNPITASSTWPMSFSQPDLSAPLLPGPQMGTNGSASVNYMKPHAHEEDLSAYNRTTVPSPNYGDQNAHELSVEQLPAFTTSPSLSPNNLSPETPHQRPSPSFPTTFAQENRFYGAYLGGHGHEQHV